jgi:hypothetical protein
MPPLSGSSGYGSGTSYTNASADYGPAAMAQALLAREGEFLSRRAAAAPPPMARAPMRMESAMPEVPIIKRPPPQKTQLERARERDELLQMQARQNPAPTRLVSGPQIIPGTVMDPSAMNAYQRDAYLPKGSSFAPTSYVASRALADDRPFDPYMHAGAQLEGHRAAGPGADFARAQMVAAARR